MLYYVLYIIYILCLIYRSLHTFAEPRVHAFVYEPSTGSCQKLPIKIMEYIKDLRNVYDLYVRYYSLYIVIYIYTCRIIYFCIVIYGYLGTI